MFEENVYEEKDECVKRNTVECFISFFFFVFIIPFPRKKERERFNFFILINVYYGISIAEIKRKNIFEKVS